MTLQTAEHRGQLFPSCGRENRSHGSALSFKAGGHWILVGLRGFGSPCNDSLRVDNAAPQAGIDWRSVGIVGMRGDVDPWSSDIALTSSGVAPRKADNGLLQADIDSRSAGTDLRPVGTDLRSVGTGSLQVGRGSRSSDVDPVSTGSIAVPIDSAPLRGNIVPRSSGILSVPVDIHPLPGDADRRSGGSGSSGPDGDPMSVDIAPLQPDWSRCRWTSVHRKLAAIAASRLRLEAAGARARPASCAPSEASVRLG